MELRSGYNQVEVVNFLCPNFDTMSVCLLRNSQPKKILFRVGMTQLQAVVFDIYDSTKRGTVTPLHWTVVVTIDLFTLTLSLRSLSVYTFLAFV